MNMIKTESQIERDFLAFVKASALGAAVKGDTYRSGMRPADARTEDIVIKFLAGTDRQVQTGTVIMNIYVPDISYGTRGRKVTDHKRIADLQLLVRDFIGRGGSEEYLLDTGSTPRTEEIEGMEQHVICVRINFQRITI